MVFINVKNFSKTGTKIVMDIEKSGEAAVITRRGRPVFLLSKATGKERGKRETVSNLRNHATKVFAELEGSGKRATLIITRDGTPVAVLSRVTDDAFRVK
jgi:antitoxin (DNA-binding transcriptional repressor) of toxin-antitoxin stability system